MKKIFFAAFAAFLTIGCNNSPQDTEKTIADTLPCKIQAKERIDTIFAMADAFAMQESRMTEDAVSECGTHVGCLQISPIMVREANRILGEELYSYDDRLDAGCSYGIFKVVMEHHNPELDIDKACKIWNKRHKKTYSDNIKTYYTANLLAEKTTSCKK